MRLVVQRVSSAEVTVADAKVASIERGFVVLVGVEPDDTLREVEKGVEKLITLRVFADEIGKMNRDLGDVDGALLVVSQFTLLADVRKGRRPSFVGAASPDHAREIVAAFVASLQDVGVPTESGVFGEHMHVSLTNDGPVTIVIDVRDGRVV